MKKFLAYCPKQLYPPLTSDIACGSDICPDGASDILLKQSDIFPNGKVVEKDLRDCFAYARGDEGEGKSCGKL